jgi:hypothetical protein
MKKGARVGVQIFAKVSQNVVAKLLGRLVSEHGLREPDSSSLKPIFLPSGGLGAKDQETNDPSEADPEKAGNDAAAIALP